MSVPTAVPRIHAVTTDDITRRPDFLDRARSVMQALGARGALHLRAPRETGRRLLELARRLFELQQETGGWLVVNDRADVALTSGARAVQLTSRSMRVGEARRIAPALSIGASVHTLEEAVQAADEGADWAVAGHVFDTRSHPEVPGRGIGLVRAMAEAVPIPVIAIGGIFPEHVPLIRAAGAHGVATIRGIWDASDAERAAIAYLSSYDTDARSRAHDHPHRQR